MFKRLLSSKNKTAIYACQISEGALKAVKCSLGSLGRKEFSGIEFEQFPVNLDDKMLAERIAQVFKRLGYNNEPVIIALNRNKSTCRYIKIPSTQPAEIERIANLQAPRYIPYQQDELITAYQIITTLRDGYSHVNLSIVHRDIIERFIKIIQSLKATGITVGLSSYGLVNLYAYLYPHDQSVVMLADLDQQQAELAIISARKSLFSRSFRFNRDDPVWQEHFADEIKRTREAYAKEVSKVLPQKILIFGQSGLSSQLAQYLTSTAGLAAEPLAYEEKLKISPQILNKINATNLSFAALFGLALEELPESLNMLPPGLKDVSKRSLQKKEIFRLGALSAAIILLFVLGLSQSLRNKSLYLKKIKQEINKINKEARPLEEMDKRLKILERRSSKKPSTMDMIRGVFQSLPSGIQLVSLSFDSDGQIVLRGNAADLNSVFNLVPQLEQSAALSRFGVKVRYATKKNTGQGEEVDFEIICQKR